MAEFDLVSEITAHTDKMTEYAVCIDNSDFPASLERNKIYLVLPDEDAALDGDIRVIDESGADYLYSANRFVPIKVPPAVRKSLALSA